LGAWEIPQVEDVFFEVVNTIFFPLSISRNATPLLTWAAFATPSKVDRTFLCVLSILHITQLTPHKLSAELFGD